MISVQGITHTFARRGQVGTRALTDVSLDVQPGRFVSLLGPSGCGKTTLLRIIAGLVKPTAGVVEIEGRQVTGPARDRVMIFQDFALLPWRTALQNVELAGELHGVPRKQRRGHAVTALEAVGLGERLTSHPHELSGGMKQRVGIARALSVSPKYLFMDEPYGALDPQIRELMQIELMRIWEADRKTVLFVTHSIDEAVFLSDQVLLFSQSPGTIVEKVDIDLPRPRYEDADAIKASEAFIEYRQGLWRDLRGHVSVEAR